MMGDDDPQAEQPQERRLRTWTVRRTAAETVLHSFVCALVAGLRRPQVVHVQRRSARGSR
jgi:hypothetical protein